MDIEGLRERVFSRADDLVFGTALTLLDYFHDQGGFEALLEFLEKGNVRTEQDEADLKDKNKTERELMTL